MGFTFTINGLSTQPTPGVSLFEAAESLHVPIPTSCLKNGKCRECIVELTEGANLLSAPTPAEHHLAPPFRLSCQARFTDAPGHVRCHTMRRGQLRIESSSTLAHALETDPRPGYGIAMDLGTTTVVLRLFHLQTGAQLAATSFENPQRFGGSDVMSRIAYDTSHPGRLLMRTLAGYAAHAIQEFPVDPAQITELVVAGNSTMRDLFFRKSVYTIGQSPYRSITELEMEEGKRASTSLITNGLRSLLPIAPDACVYGPPIISGHVGADAAACMLAVDIANEDRTIAVMDIGTNTELIIGNRHRILAASCPAGPAFEGGAITCGMPALEGAIEDVRILPDGRYALGVIGSAAPEGICGSGLVDLLSELLRTGQMNEMGRFEEGSTVTLAPGVTFSEADINELAQAKGANVAGLQTVFADYGIDFEDIDVFYLAGGFGRHLKIDAARRIGLIPDIPDHKIVAAGNLSIEGASIALLSPRKRLELESLVRRVEFCRLETHPQFFDFFVEGCQFKPVRRAAQVEAA